MTGNTGPPCASLTHFVPPPPPPGKMPCLGPPLPGQHALSRFYPHPKMPETAESPCPSGAASPPRPITHHQFRNWKPSLQRRIPPPIQAQPAQPPPPPLSSNVSAPALKGYRLRWRPANPHPLRAQRSALKLQWFCNLLPQPPAHPSPTETACIMHPPCTRSHP